MKYFFFSLILFFSFSSIEAKDFPFLKNETNAFSAFERKQEVNSENPVRVDVIVDRKAIVAGETFWVAIRLDVAEGWKAYWKNPGESGFPIDVEWVLPPKFTVEDLQWPTPQRSVVNDIVVFGYTGETVLLAQVTPPESLKVGEQVDLGAEVKWLVCSDTTCLPGDSYEVVKLGVGTASSVDPSAQEAFDQALAEIPVKSPEEVYIKEVTPQAILLHIDNVAYPGEIEQAFFFPEESAGIDLKRKVTAVPEPDDSGMYVTIKREASEMAPDSLTGVLKLVSSDDEEVSWYIHLPISGKAPEAVTQVAPPFSIHSEEEYPFLMILLFAFLGGMILNLMPCVLPVVSIKVLGFIQMSKDSRKETFLHGLLFSVGVLISFLVLAGLLLLLKAYGHAVGWGFQLQDPAFIAVLICVLLIAALVLFGVCELGTSLASKAGGAVDSVRKKESSKISSFFSGVLATVVATPCSGPFLGIAMGVAVTIPWYLSLLVFTFVGLGMASPYLLLSANPKWLKFLPKPGAWMETFKQLMGFLMLLTVMWLVWVFIAQTDTGDVLRLFIGMFLISVGAWVFGRWATPIRSKKVKTVGTIVALVFAVVGVYMAFMAGKTASEYDSTTAKLCIDDVGWETFNPNRVAELRKEGKPIFIDFTAKWCLLCQSNLLTLMTPSVDKKMEELGVVKMMADWTRSDPTITEWLAKFGRNSVPLYIYYPPGEDSEPLVLPQVLTPDVVLEYLNAN